MKKILAIDDQQDNLTSIKAVIKNHMQDCLVLTALSGKEGIEMAHKEQPDVILLDIIMPQMDGYEVCRRLKENNLSKHIPIVMLTAIRTDSDSRIKGLSLGADAFLSKPIDPIELSAQINVMLRIKEAEDKLRAEKRDLEEVVLEKTDELIDSEKKYKALYENAPLPYQSLNEDGNIIDVNFQWLNTLGYDRDEVIGKWYGDFLNSDSRVIFKENFPLLKKCGEVHDVPFKIIAKNGQFIDIYLNGLSTYNPDGSFKQTYCVFQDITERKKADEALQESEKKFKDLVEMLPEAIFEMDENFNLTYVNQQALDIFGFTNQDMLKGLNGLALIAEEDQIRAKANFAIRFKGGNPGISEYNAIRKDGSVFPILFHANSIMKNGQFFGLRGVITDLAEHKSSEEKIRKLSRAVEQSPSVIAITDLDGRLEYVNPKYSELTGYSSEEVLGKKTNIMKSGTQTADFYKELWDDITSGKTWRGEFHNKKKNGELFWEAASVSPIFDKNGKATNYIKVAEDITHQKLAEDRLRESQAYNKILLETTSIGLSLCRMDGTIVDLNQAYADVIGYSIEEAKKLKYWDITPEKYMKIEEVQIESLNKTGKYDPYEKEYIHKDGHRVPVRMMGSIIEIGSEKFIWSSVENITVQKKAAQKLKESEEKYRTMIETSNDMIWMLDSEGNFTFFNKKVEVITGYLFNDWEGKSFLPIVMENELPFLKDVFKKTMSGESLTYEMKLKIKSGAALTLSVNTAPLFADNNIIGMVSFARDVTEQTKAEVKLRESEARFKALHNASFGGIAIHDNGIIKDCNQGLSKLSGYSVDELIAANGIELLIAEDSRQTVIKNIKAKYETPYEVIGIRKNGENYPLRIEARTIPYEGKDMRVVEFRDITEQKRAEQTLIESEEKYRSLMENLPVGVFRSTYEGQVISANLAMAEIYGYDSVEDLLKLSASDYYHEDNPREKMLSELKKEGYLLGNETFENKKDGSLIWVSANYKASFNTEGEIIYIDGVVIDITKSKMIEQSLKDREAFLNTLLDAIPIPVFYKDTQWKYIGCNRAFESFFGLKKEDVIGKTVFEISPLKLAEEYHRKDLQLFEKGGVQNYESQIQNPKGGLYNVIFNKAIFKDTKGEGIGLIGTILDITDRIKAQENLKNALIKATESDRLKSAFLATMSHELRTPLNAIIGFSDIINEELSIEDVVSFNKHINSSGHHLLSIVEDLFDITLIESGETRINKSDENLTGILSDVHEIIKTEKQAANKGNLDLLLILPEKTESLKINTDISKFKQILINLLKNALKFTHEGYVKYGFNIEKIQEETVFRFFVEDTGIGIPKEKRELIFDIFRQVEDSNTRLYGGTGIGLSISKKLTELLGGKIWLESVEGKGTTFYFTLPYDEKSNVDVINETTEKVEFHPLSNRKIESNTILIVEDVKESYELLKIHISNLGFKTIWAENGEVAVNCCKENGDIALVFMDINMPVMNGYDATNEIKKSRPNLPIIAQTAYAVSGDREKIMESGFDDYISKPIKKEELMRKIGKLLSKRGSG